ncbi:MAG: exonuclease domain-containing protein [Burkholderiales bacterium]
MKFAWDEGNFAFVDVETTGGTASEDRITEIAIITVDEGVMESWSSLVDPDCEIPPSIQSLTGITNLMVRAAPTFGSISDEVASRLHGHLFVAHNARFDYGFVRQELKRAGVNYATRPLCTVRLSRALFPSYRGFSLDNLIKRFALNVSQRHRALPDARALVDLMAIYAKLFDAEKLDTTIRTLIKQATLPPNLSGIDIEQIPQGPGVYRFYGHNDMPLYIGKSINLRKRIMSHFTISAKQGSSQRVGLEARRIEFDSTAGDLSASVLELQQIHALQPLHNKKGRKGASGYLLRLSHRLPLVEIVASDAVLSLRDDEWYGPFFSTSAARSLLTRLAKEHRLCMIMMGLEKRKPPCFGHQLGACDGACIDPGKGEKMMLRLAMALAKYRLPSWPYRGALVVAEKDPSSGREEAHVFHDWCHLGRARSDDEVAQLVEVAARGRFRADMFYLLRQNIIRQRRAGGILRVVPIIVKDNRIRDLLHAASAANSC